MFNRLWSMSLKLLLVSSFFLPMSVWAAHNISIIATSPFPAEVAASSTTTAVYTVTNNASRISLTPVDQTQYPSGVSRLSSSTCGGLIGPRQSCTIQLQLQAPSTPQTISFALKQWARPSADAVQLPISVNVASSESSALSVAVGNDASSSQPVVALSTNRAVDWESAAISGLPAEGQLNAASCTGSGSTAICIGAGQAGTGSSHPALLVQSVDGGDTWSVVEVTGSLPNAIYNGASCTGSESDAVCIAVGQNRSGTGTRIVAVGTNAGSTWAMKTVPSPVGTNASYSTGSCTGSGATAICVAAGRDNDVTLLDMSIDGGMNWTNVIDGEFPEGFMRSASCTGTGSAAVCVVVGQQGAGGGSEALILVGTNTGSSWVSESVLPGVTVLLNSVSCTGTVCAAVGQKTIASVNTPVIVVSTNSGADWSDKSIVLPSVESFNAVSCTGGESNAITCAAVGNSSTSTPTIVVSADGGATWTARSVTNPPTDSALLLTVDCKGAGATAICVAGGYISGSGSAPPVIISSNDGGTTWTVRSVTGFDPVNGVINGTAGAVGAASLTSFGTNSSSAGSGFGVSYPQKTFGIKNKLEHFIK